MHSVRDVVVRRQAVNQRLSCNASCIEALAVETAQEVSKRLRRCLQRARARSTACRRLRVRDTASLSLPLRTRYMSLSDAQKRKLSKKDIKKLCKKASKSKSKCKKEKEHCTYKKKKCSPKAVR